MALIHLGIWTIRIVCLFVVYAMLRLWFLISNRSAFLDLPSGDIALAFVHGLRFDLCAIATLNAPIILIYHVVKFVDRKNRFERLSTNFFYFLFLLVNIPVLAAGLVDCDLSKFTGRRMTPDFFGIAQDIGDQGLGIALQYWPQTLIGLVVTGIFVAITWRKASESVTTYDCMFAVKAFGMLAMSVLAMRGGFQLKPLGPSHAISGGPPVLALLTLNTPFTLMRTPPSEAVTRVHHFSSITEVRSILAKPTQPSGNQKSNMVILIVESLATEYVGALNDGVGYTPFIDSLIGDQKAVSFKHSFANGKRSIDAMPAIFAALPAWREAPFVTSPFVNNKIVTLPRALKSSGYSSVFFHGARNGSMHFDVFSKMAGFDRYVGLDEYPDVDRDHDGQWGIFDRPFLQFALREISALPPPFVAGIFTLSSHNPFVVPKDETGRFPKGSLPIHESIGYADDSLRDFFKTASQTSWFKDTIFVITGDHTSISDVKAYQNEHGRFRVPIIFYDPSGKLKPPASDLASHIDIQPTLLDLVGVPADQNWLFGRPLFHPEAQPYAMNQEYDVWWYEDANDQFSWSYDAGFKTKSDQASSEFAVSRFKALHQYFVNGLLDDSWTEAK